MISNCSLLNDRSLTKDLIQSSNCPLKCFHRFSHTPEWVDGLDVWSSTEIVRKNDINTRNIDFNEDIGLYLPRYNSIPTSPNNNSKLTTTNSFPERLKQLFKKEKDLLSENDLNLSSSDDQLSISLEDNQPSNNIPQSNSIEKSSSKVRFPLRQVQSKNPCQENKFKQQNGQSLNREKLKSLLKEQLTSLFTRETTNMNQKKTLIRIPSVEIKHQNLPPRIIPSVDPTLIMERYAKLQQLLMSPTLTQPTINNRITDIHQSSLLFEGTANASLTVTPLDFSSTKSLQSSTLESQISERENYLSSNRPLTQPVLVPFTIHQRGTQQQIILKQNFETGFISSSGDFVISNKNSTDEQSQTNRRYHRHHRSSSKNPLQRAKTLDLLPPLIAGKRLQIPISAQRHS